MKKALIVSAILALAFSANAGATIITINGTGVVGIFDMNGLTPDPANPTDRQTIANHILAMNSSSSDASYFPGAPGVYYTSSGAYSGTVDLGYKVDGNVTGYAGYTYLLAKYDGPNGGFVLFHIPSIGSSIPSSLGVTNVAGNVTYWTEYGLSGWTAYNWVPDGGSVVMLLGAALMGLAGFRRMLK
jgi:hypothetical protein